MLGQRSTNACCTARQALKHITTCHNILGLGWWLMLPVIACTATDTQRLTCCATNRRGNTASCHNGWLHSLVVACVGPKYTMRKVPRDNGQKHRIIYYSNALALTKHAHSLINGVYTQPQFGYVPVRLVQQLQPISGSSSSGSSRRRQHKLQQER